MKKTISAALMCLALIFSHSLLAGTLSIPLIRVAKQGRGHVMGTVVATDTQYGLLLVARVHEFEVGNYGFHVHEHPACGEDGQAAGGHLDPMKTGQHLGPYNANGHLGDLPTLTIDKVSKEALPVLAPRLTVADLKGHSLMIHEGGDNYSDFPIKLGGGGQRVACGVID